MDAEILKRIEEIFHAALEINPDQRESFLNENCGEDIDLRTEVESLLAFRNTSGNLLDSPPESLAAEIFSEQKKHNDLSGTDIGHYKLQKLLGKGGMGEVYLAEDIDLNRQVAVKFLPAELTGNADRLKRFEREAQTASGLNHPNILTVHQFGTENYSRFIVTEFVNGVTLSEKMAGERLGMSEILDVALQVAAALAAAHEAGIIHRDIKPDNIMIRDDGFVKVLDFGLAKLVESPGNIHQTDPEAKTRALVKTNPGVVMGTADYMSPEQARGLAADARTDIFSFGVLLYEMVTGQKPFTGETVSHTIVNILEKETPPVSVFFNDCPAELEKIIQKSLAKKPDERFRTVTELMSSLKRLQKRLEFEVQLHKAGETGRKGLAETPDKTAIISPSLLPPNNLTENSSPIIGREKEIAEIADLLKQENVRLLTMTGIGGTGKTRLAQTVAQSVLGDFADGVFFVALASITDYKLVVSTIAQTLGVKESGSKPILELLKNHLREKQILLVVDNFEQVIDAGNNISELLKSGDKLKILITSREPLHLKDEREYVVPSLAVPIERTQISLNELSNYEAVRFFVERARFAQPDFGLTDENSESIAEICQRLDGLPLAIELAAARVKLFSPPAILTRLSDSLKLLTGGAKDLPERQKTMRGAIAWSYELLDVAEKEMLNRLAVFAEGFMLDAAEAIALSSRFSVPSSTAEKPGLVPGGTQNTNSGIDIYDGISSLLDKSLIIRGDQDDGEPRFRMLVVVKEFALEKLEESGEANEIKRRHAAFYNGLSKEAEPGFRGEKSSEWLETIELEHANFRAALEWTLLHETQTALRIVVGLSHFWLWHGYLVEGNKWTRMALETGGDSANPKLLAEVLNSIGKLSWMQGNLDEAERFLIEALQISREIADKTLIAYSLLNFSNIKLLQGDFAAAQPLSEESFEIANEINEKYVAARAANSLGEIFRGNQDYKTAQSYYEKSLSIARQGSFNPVIQMACDNLSAVACYLEDYPASRVYGLESLKLAEESGDKLGIGFILERFLALAVTDGEPERAVCLFGALESIYESVGYKIEGVDEIFLNRYLDQAREAIGEEKYNRAERKGRKLNLEEAIVLAREGESDIAATHITDEAGSRNPNILTNDALEVQTAIFAPSEPTNLEISRPNNFLSNIGHKRVFVMALIIFLLTAGGFFAYRYFTTEKQIKSIAVLPFINETGDANNEYLSDGLTDALINKLSQLPEMKVIARSSSSKYKGNSIDMRKIADALGVQAIVTGRITKRGDNLNISVEMTDAAENTHIWGEQYNRKVFDALDVQEDIVQSVSEKLNLKLSGTQQQQIAKQATDNSQAYQFYLNGVFYQRQNGANNLKKAIEYQNQAIGLDPNFALAYAELAFNYGALVEIGAIDPADGKPKARAAAEKAVALDETLAEAHLTLAYIENQDLDWTKAEQNYQRTIELNPNYAAAHTLYAAYLSQLGRTEEALTEIKKAQELDPLRVGLTGNEGIILYYARRYDEAVSKMRDGLKPEPENAPARVFLGRAYAADGQYEKAIREFQIAYKTDSSSTDALIYLGLAYALSGKRSEAAEILNRLKTTNKYVSPAALAILYAALGDKESAFKSLEQAYNKRDLNLQFLKVEPGYDPLHEDSRFQEWVQKVGFSH